jgi:hypothetical protein
MKRRVDEPFLLRLPVRALLGLYIQDLTQRVSSFSTHPYDSLPHFRSRVPFRSQVTSYQPSAVPDSSTPIHDVRSQSASPIATGPPVPGVLQPRPRSQRLGGVVSGRRMLLRNWRETL